MYVFKISSFDLWDTSTMKSFHVCIQMSYIMIGKLKIINFKRK